MTSAVDPLTMLDARLRGDPGRPLVTWYDGVSGERVELSAATTHNWVTKVANLLVDDLMLDPGATMSVELGAHWQSVVLTLGAWAAGLTVVRSDLQVSARVVGPEAVSRYADDPQADVLVASSLRPLGGRFVEPLPASWLDFAVVVPPQPDLALDPRPMHDPAAVFDGVEYTPGELVEAGNKSAQGAGLAAGGRLVTDHDPTSAAGLAVAVLGPLAVGGSLVLLAQPDDALRDAVARQEQPTCTAWR